MRFIVFFVALSLISSEESETCADRAAKAQTLLDALTENGATLSVPLEVRADGDSGVGVFAATDVPADTLILEVPHELWVKSVGGADDALPLALAEHMISGPLPIALNEKRGPRARSAVAAAYLETLPAECPPNLATRSEADLAVAAASMHGWKVELQRREAALLRREIPELDEDRIRHLLCMKQVTLHHRSRLRSHLCSHLSSHFSSHLRETVSRLLFATRASAAPLHRPAQP